MKASKATRKHSQPARDGRELPCQRSHFSRGGGTGWHHGTRPKKSQTTKPASALVVRWIKISLGHSNNDLRARNAAPQPLRGGAKQRLRGVPWSQHGARWGGWGRICTHTWLDFEDLHQDQAPLAPENHLPHALGRLRRARGSPICARQTAQGRGVEGRGLVGGAKAGSG